MRATVMYGAGDVHVENVPDPAVIEPTDAVVRVTFACICGSDLWPYKIMERSETGRRQPPRRGPKADVVMLAPPASRLARHTDYAHAARRSAPEPKPLEWDRTVTFSGSGQTPEVVPSAARADAGGVTS
jgi:hypothetical protein